MDKSKAYSSDFYAYTNIVAIPSARVIVPKVVNLLSPESVLDVGCGAGAWCSVWIENGVPKVMGADGEYVDRAHLLIASDQFLAADLSQPFLAGSRFDLVTSLEVAEHIHESQADVFVENLVRHGDIILFSAAVPGQGGEFHVNEQPLEYWREKFAGHGYQCFDPVRPIVREEHTVAGWYRFNTLLYVAKSRVATLPKAIKSCAVLPGSPIPSNYPIWWTLRNAILGMAPPSIKHALVRFKGYWIRRRHALH